ncbi:MAG: hypothetical protein KJO19_11600, partial [Woeseia sp.]|nr:hypothetical protein [Woeseia sp.]
MQRWVAFTTTAVLVAVLVALVGYWQATRWLATPLELPDEGVEFQIAPGTALATVSAQLAARGVLDRPRLFTWYSRLSGKASAVHAGEY